MQAFGIIDFLQIRASNCYCTRLKHLFSTHLYYQIEHTLDKMYTKELEQLLIFYLKQFKMRPEKFKADLYCTECV